MQAVQHDDDNLMDIAGGDHPDAANIGGGVSDGGVLYLAGQQQSRRFQILKV